MVPDEVLLSLGVETFDKVLKSAKSLNDDRIKKTIAVAKSYASPAEHIQTDYIGIEPRYAQSDVTRELLGYVVRKMILIRLKEVPKFEVHRGGVVWVLLQHGSWWGSRHGSMTQNVVQSIGGASLDSDSTLSPGQISIRVNVSASFVLE